MLIPPVRSSGQDAVLPVRSEPGLSGFDPLARHMLNRAGIQSMQQLRAIGSVQAYACIRAANVHVGLSLFWTLEGALTGQPKWQVEREHRVRLLSALAEHRLPAS